MRKSKVLALAVASVVVGGSKIASATQLTGPVTLFTTASDFAGSYIEGPPGVGITPTTGTTQSGWSGWGTSASTYVAPAADGGVPTGQGTSNSTAVNTPTETLSFNGPDLDGSTLNGLGNYNNQNNGTASAPDDTVGAPGAGLGNYTGTSFVGYSNALGGSSVPTALATSPGGSLTVNNYAGGYDTITTGNMLQGGTAAGNVAFLNTLYQSHGSGILEVNFTSPLGGTTISTAASGAQGSPYFLIGFLIYSNNSAFASGWVNAPAGFTATNPDPGSFGDAPGAYEVNHGTYWTGYIPYSGISAPSSYTNATFGIIVNSGDSQTGVNSNYAGNLTIDNIEVLPAPLGTTYTWALTGGGSWATAANWTNIAAVANSQGGIAVFNQTTAGATVTMDIVSGSPNWTVGNIDIDNTSGYVFSTRAKSTFSKTGGLIIDNGGVPAEINDNGGTQTFAIPLQLNSIVNEINVVNSGDGLIFTQNISGSGGLQILGAGAVTLANVAGSSNTYTGGTNVNGGNLIVNSAGALPPTTNLGIGNFNIASSLTFTAGLGTVNVGNLVLNDAANLTVNIANNVLSVNYGATGNGDPFGRIAIGSAVGGGDGIVADSGVLSVVDNGTSVIISGATQTITSNIAGTNAFQVSGTGTVTLSSPSNTYSGATNLEGGTINITTAGALPAGTALTVGDGINGSGTSGTNPLTTTVNLGTGLGNIKLSNLTLNTAGTTLFNTGSDIISVNYAAAGNADPAAAIEAAITAGQIADSAALPKGYGYGLSDNGSTVSFGRTLIGDVNVDGTVNLTDLLDLLNSYGQTGQTWGTGDTNADGSVNLTDLLNLLNNYGQSANTNLGGFSGAQVVPEPASMSLLGLGAAGLLSRRRRKA